MKLFVALFLLLTLYTVCKAQSDSSAITNKRIYKKLQELHSKHVDTIVCYYVDCIGYYGKFENKGCEAFDIRYLLWGENGIMYIQRFDNCTEHKQLIDSFSFITIIKKNYYRIFNERLRYPTYTSIINGKKVELMTIRDHSCHDVFEIHVGGRVVTKDVDEFALNTKYVDDKYYNKYYTSNQKSVLNKLKTMIEKAVYSYESQKP